MYVCLCFGVTSQDVADCVACGATTSRDVAKMCRAGSECGRCRRTVRMLIATGEAPARTASTHACGCADC